MTGAPSDMETNRQSGEPDDLTAMDRALLLALSSVRRDGAPLSVFQEDLLDEWMAGQLLPADSDRAAALIARNGLAAERVLERRLVGAANSGSEVPAALSSRVLRAAQSSQVEQTAQSAQVRPRQSARFRWSILSWSAAGAAFAATIAIAVFGLPNWRENAQSYQRIQLAMVTIDDRRPFSGSPQVRSLRSNAPALATAAATEGFRDFDIPADLLRRAIASAGGADRATVASQLLAYLPPGTEAAGQSQVVIDSALANALSREWSARTIVPIRVYDLGDARAKAIRDSLRAKLGTAPQVLLTVRR